MSTIVIVDRYKDRALANAESFVKAGVIVADVDMRANGRTIIGSAPDVSAGTPVLLRIAHQGDSKDADILYTSSFSPGVVAPPQAWICRDLPPEDHLEVEEARQILKWALDGKPTEDERRPPILRLARGKPFLAAVAVLCQVALSQWHTQADVLKADWWTVALSGGAPPSRESLQNALSNERPAELSDAQQVSWRIVQAFIGRLVDRPRDALGKDEIDKCLHAVRECLHD